MKTNWTVLVDALKTGRVNLDYNPGLRDGLISAFDGAKELMDVFIPDSQDTEVVAKAKAVLSEAIKISPVDTFSLEGVTLVDSDAKKADSAALTREEEYAAYVEAAKADPGMVGIETECPLMAKGTTRR